MQFFYKREVKGAIAILLVVIMLPMMVLSAFMVDTSRYNLAKANVSSAGDLTMNAALADYDTILKDVYGLFAMSQTGDLDAEIEQYFIDTVVSYDIVSEEDAGDYVERLLGTAYKYLMDEDKDIVNFLEMSVDESNVTVTALEDSSLVNSSVLEKQIVEYMKYRGPVEFGMSFLDSLSAFEKVEEQTVVIEKQVQAQEQMGNVAPANEALYQAVVAYDEKYNKLEPEVIPADNFHLKNYGNIMLSYRDRYQEINRLALIFCCASYLGKWDSDSTKIKILNSTGDYIVNSGGKWGIPTKYETHTSNPDLSSAKNAVDSAYTTVTNSGFESVLTAYGATKFVNGNLAKAENSDFVSADAREKAVSDFQVADLYYKTSYTSFINNCSELEKYVHAVEVYDEKAQAQINAYQTQINELTTKETEANKTITDETAVVTSANNVLEDLASENMSLYLYINERVVTYKSNLAKIAEGVTETEKKELQEKNEELKAEADEKEKRELGVDTATWWGIIYNASVQIDNSSIKIDEARDFLTVAPGDKTTIENQKKALEEEKSTIDANMQAVLGEYASSINTYNSDLKLYYQYIDVAKNIIDTECKDIADEFTLMYNNLTELRTLLLKCKTDFEKAKVEIESYMTKVDAWETSNNAYAAAGGDNFSDTNTAGIREADNTFDKDEINELYDCIVEEYNRLDGFIRAIDANFSYMDVKKIMEISNAGTIKTVIESCSSWYSISNYQTMASEITIEQCNAYFVYYDNIDATALDELSRMTEPYPCCKFMNYLRQTYSASENVMTEDDKNDALINKASYTSIKEGGDVTKAIDDDTNGKNDYGYTYETSGVTLGGEGWPSSGEYKLTVDTNKSSSSDGVTANKSVASEMLKGLSDAMKTGRDKLLVLSYLFENFSYNTVVQDQARDNGVKLGWPLNCEGNLYTPYLYTAKTSSGIYFAQKSEGSAQTISPLYGAEIEYILFGNSEPKKNVDYTKAAIFAVRFLFNTVYAFTNSEVRNETRTIAVAIQAASLGVVPYQLVQVVLQLALAMGESAVDLKNMEAGAKVAIVKNSDTWTMSVKGAINLAKDAVDTEIRNAADKALEAVQGKITEVVNAKAQDLVNVVGDVKADLLKSVDSATEEIMNNISLQVESILEQELSKYAFYKDVTFSDNKTVFITVVNGNVAKAFDDTKSELDSIFGGLRADSLEGMVWTAARPSLYSILDEVEQQIKDEVTKQADITGVRTAIYKSVYNIKSTISEKINSVADSMLSGVVAKTTDMVDDLQRDLIGLANEKTEAAKDKVVEELNGFTDSLFTKVSKTEVSTGSLANANGNAVSSSAEGSIIKFGYSDYLMLFTFVALCADDKNGAMMARVADVIQCNIANAGEGSALQHEKGADFKMANARTYVSVEADVDLNMMFLNLGVFQKQVEAYNEELAEDEKIDLGSTLQIHYVGIAGY